jgi:protoporphyrinogen oxidase
MTEESDLANSESKAIDEDALSNVITWKKEEETSVSGKAKKRFAIVGGGWGGWGASKVLCEAEDVEVILLDALPDPTGKTPYLSKNGKPVEAGTRGFWKDYPNINKLCEELGLDENDVFTPFTNSSFYSPDGLEATAPVFSEGTFPDNNLPLLGQLSGKTFPQLPSPLGQVLATFPLFERIPLADRASMVGLLIATIDCLGNDESVQRMYDRMTAHDLFIRFGLSKRLVEDFIKPTL